MNKTKIAIIGGGLAGLYAARLLESAVIDFVLIEARDRLGGRILSVGQDGLPSENGFDLGPSWFWPQMQPAMAELVEELGLPAFCQNSEGDVIFERMSREPAQRYRGTAQEQQSMRLVGGTAALIRKLAEDIPASKVSLGRQVMALSLTATGVEVSLGQGDSATETIVVDHVIAALPPRLLEGSVAFTPEIDLATAQRWQDTPTWMAPHAKFFALYDRPFWREAGLSGTAQSMVGPMVEMHDATTASGGAALFGFLGVGAQQRSTLGEEALTAACIAQFERVFGSEARRPIATLLKDWAADPLTATEADTVASGHVVSGDAPWVTGRWAERLTLAAAKPAQAKPAIWQAPSLRRNLRSAKFSAVWGERKTMPDPSIDRHRSRRNIWVLAAAQSLGGANAPIVISLGGLVGQKLSSDPALITLPVSLLNLRLALGTLPAAYVMRRFGRRSGYVLGGCIGMLGGMIAAFGIMQGSFVIFCVGTGLAGFYSSYVQSYRFAAADGAVGDANQKAIARVMLGGLIAAVIGPQLVIWTRDAVTGMPFAGSFISQAVLAGLAIPVILMLRRQPAPKAATAAESDDRPLRETLTSRRYLIAKRRALSPMAS